MRWLCICTVIAACGGGDDAAAPPQRAAGTPLDALPGEPASAPPVIDDVGMPATAEPLPARARKVILVTLDSTPPGAIATVDGVVIGNTPTYWEGEVDGCAHEFRFELPGYTTRRHRFVPVQDGFVHGKLARVLDGDGGVPEVAAAIPPCPMKAPAARSRRPRPAAPPTAVPPDAGPRDAAPPTGDASSA